MKQQPFIQCNLDQKNKLRKGRSRMHNPETLATMCTQDTGRRQTKEQQKTQHKKLKIRAKIGGDQAPGEE
jgi:hypothetical protein